MIHTERLTLRAPRPDDLDGLHRVFSDPAAMRYWSHPAHESLEQTQSVLEGMIASHIDTGLEFVVEHRGRAIGKAGMWRMGEIGYILHPDHWRRGLGREAVGRVVDAAFEKYPDLDAITAEIDPENVASAALLARLGFRQVDYVENAIEIAGVWCDSTIWQRPRPGTATASARGPRPA